MRITAGTQRNGGIGSADSRYALQSLGRDGKIPFLYHDVAREARLWGKSKAANARLKQRRGANERIGLVNESRRQSVQRRAAWSNHSRRIWCPRFSGDCPAVNKESFVIEGHVAPEEFSMVEEQKPSTTTDESVASPIKRRPNEEMAGRVVFDNEVVS